MNFALYIDALWLVAVLCLLTPNLNANEPKKVAQISVSNPSTQRLKKKIEEVIGKKRIDSGIVVAALQTG